MARSLVSLSPLKRTSHLLTKMSREETLRLVLPLIESFRKYHRHEVIGLPYLPREGGMLCVVNHSLATYDIILLMLALYKELNRIPRPLIDRLFFKVPFIKEIVTSMGAIEGSQEEAKKLLDSDEIVTVAPGGMFEALRPSKEKYQIRWQKRYGFARLAIATRKPIILAACPKADDMYKVYPSYLTNWIYQTYRLPIFLARGVGPTPIPRPIKLVHHLSEPIYPPKMPKSIRSQDATVLRFHNYLVEKMELLIKEAIEDKT